MSGKQAERWAADFLQQQGLTLLTQNYRSRFGEIDLIMHDEDALVFVEFRQRSNHNFGGAAASIDQYKQKRLIQTAQCYLATHFTPQPCRFDAVLMDNESGLNVQWLKNAFDAG